MGSTAHLVPRTHSSAVWALILRYSLHLRQQQVLGLSAWLKSNMLGELSLRLAPTWDWLLFTLF